MRLSKKSRYGLRALVDLSVRSKNGQVSLNSIAERNGISLQYLEQVFAALKRAGLVKSIKGPQGGYLLERPANQISVLDIVKALEGSYELEDEEQSETIECREIPLTIQELIIDPVNQKIHELLAGISLEDLEDDYLYKAESSADMYFI